ncbi:MAG: LacI family DNA-binding transcriptional regulator [Candidatus Hydrogenedentes bacterium]|nr:LacI family DNA-binding transcriptional regulator [Candidatus Hydrogenedentota bacterium]
MTKRDRVTTSDIARISGISRSTVSAVLNGKRKVRESTRQKVLDAIRECDYGAGLVARSLVGELSRMVAVLAPNIGSPYHMNVFQGISDVLMQQGYHLLLHNVRPENVDDPESLESLQAYRPAGYIVLRGGEGREAAHARAILKEGVPLVTIGRLEFLESDCIDFDERAAMRMVTDYVVQQGHRFIGYLAGPSFSVGMKRRQMGFVESLINHDIPRTNAVMVATGETALSGYHAALDLLRDAGSRPSAVICFNDMLAMGVYRAASELKLHIPDDVSVAGFDGIDFGELLGPPLTSVDISPFRSGALAAELLLKILRDEKGRNAVTEEIVPRLLKRGSVRRMAPEESPAAETEMASP